MEYDTHGNAIPPYPGWAPYCLMCSTMGRMTPTDFGWKCEGKGDHFNRVGCGNTIGRNLKHYNMTVKNLYGHNVRDLYPKLPDAMAAYHPVTNEPIMVERGKQGFTAVGPDFDVELFNTILFVTPELQNQMLKEAGVTT